MTSPILFVGGEDIDFQFVNCSLATSNSQCLLDTTAGRFRSGYARYGINFNPNNNGSGMATTMFLRSQPAFAASAFWFTGRLWNNGSVGGSQSTLNVFRLISSDGVARLRMRVTAANVTAFAIEKINAAGTVTQLGSNTLTGFSLGPSTPDKLDVFVNYAVAGQLTIYVNGVQIFNFSGDVTTDSVTSLAYIDIGQAVSSSNGNSGVAQVWSEIIVATRDTRNMSLVTQAATALGNTDTFTSGAVANINKNLTTDTAPDFSTTAAQIQQYQVTPAPPTGSFSIVSVVQHGRVTLGASGPTHIDFMVRTGAADFVSSDLAPTGAWGLLTNNWDLNPNTSAAWQTSELPAASTSFNFGYKSVV